MDYPFIPVFLLGALLYALFQLGRGRLDDTIARLSRHWIPFVAFFFLCFAIAGHTLNSFGIPSLFRDDPQLYELHNWTAIRNSAVLWSHFFSTLFLFTIWAFVYHFEVLESSGSASADRPVTARQFILLNGGPMVVFLLIAAALPRQSDSLVAWSDLVKAIFGAAFAIGALWLFTAAGKWLLTRLRDLKGGAERENPHPWWSRLSLLIIGSSRRATADAPGEQKATLMGRSQQFFRDLMTPPVIPDGRLAAIQAATSFVLVLAVSLIIVTRYPVIQSSVSILLVLAWLLTLYFSIAFAWPWLRLWLVVAGAAWIIYANLGPPHHTFPGLASYYQADTPVPISPGEPKTGRRSPNQLLASIDTLARWRQGPGTECRNMVILATSGGAYRAGYWTAAVLDELQTRAADGGDLEGLTDCMRLITGASGGMVGAAYYVVMRHEALQDGNIASVVERLNADTQESRAKGPYKTVTPYPRDSLTPVAQQLAQRDLFHVLLPRQTHSDRGVVLEEQWRTLNFAFSQLRAAEREGRIPSLILSPMAFAGGAKPFAQPLLISNLKVDTLAGPGWRYAFPFFALFPDVQETFLLRTAVRMNATFPYVSPSVSLPTAPRARVVDAGYYDNYGLSTAASWLFSARDSDKGKDKDKNPTPIDWLTANDLGVIVIQIRAFPFESSLPDEPDACHAKRSNDDTSGQGFQFLTTPIEALSAVRESGMNIRNDQQLAMVKELAGDNRVRWVTFENTANVGMSWYLTPHELDCLKQEVVSPHNREQWTKLKAILESAEASSPPDQ